MTRIISPRWRAREWPARSSEGPPHEKRPSQSCAVTANCMERFARRGTHNSGAIYKREKRRSGPAGRIERVKRKRRCVGGVLAACWRTLTPQLETPKKEKQRPSPHEDTITARRDHHRAETITARRYPHCTKRRPILTKTVYVPDVSSERGNRCALRRVAPPCSSAMQQRRHDPILKAACVRDACPAVESSSE